MSWFKQQFHLSLICCAVLCWKWGWICSQPKPCVLINFKTSWSSSSINLYLMCFFSLSMFPLIWNNVIWFINSFIQMMWIIIIEKSVEWLIIFINVEFLTYQMIYSYWRSNGTISLWMANRSLFSSFPKVLFMCFESDSLQLN